MWSQTYNPLGNQLFSTLAASAPLIVMMTLIFVRWKAHRAAAVGLTLALAISTMVFGFPAQAAVAATFYGAAFGLLPIGWLVLNMIFLYRLTERSGLFKIVQSSITTITQDKRLQLLLVAFCFGAFFEGAAGFGAPVAVTSAMLMGLGFPSLQACSLALLANTAPVAFGSIGTPVIALQGVTGLDILELSAAIGTQLPWFSLLIPLWLVWLYAGFDAVRSLAPAIFVAGASFALPQFLVATYHGPWLVDIIAALCSITALTLFLRIWKPSSQYIPDEFISPAPSTALTRADLLRAWRPWMIMTIAVFIWGMPQSKALLDSVSLITIEIPFLHNLTQRVPPVVIEPVVERAVFHCNWLSAAGTGILLAALIAGRLIGFSIAELAREYGQTVKLIRTSLLTIALILALGFVMRYSGLDATLGVAFASTGLLYPFFGTLLGWLGVIITGSDTSANVLFGSLQRITAEQLGLSAVLMAAANSSGGVMGKMLNIQSIVVAGAATGQEGQESGILRSVLWHSIVLAVLMGLLVMLQAYVLAR
jgi:lactate permease